MGSVFATLLLLIFMNSSPDRYPGILGASAGCGGGGGGGGSGASDVPVQQTKAFAAGLADNGLGHSFIF